MSKQFNIVLFTFLVYDESKEIHSADIFPDTKSYVNSRLNETVFDLEGPYFPLYSPIDAAIQTVVDAETAACLKIIKLIKTVKREYTRL